jgi:streptogramin lyase
MRRKKGFIPVVLAILLFAAVSVASVSASDDDLIVTTESVGSGLGFKAPQGIAVEADGFLVVVDPALASVMRVDPVTGDRTILSDADTGSGPAFSTVRAIAVAADGTLVVLDSRAVMRVDPTTCDRTIVSGDYVP